MRYSIIVRLLGIGAVINGVVAIVLLLIGTIRGGAVLALACVACATCLGLVMVRYQSWTSATAIRSVGKRLDTTGVKLSGLETILKEQSVLMRDLETRLSTLDSVPESLHAVSGVVASTHSSVLDGTSSLRYVAERTVEIRENLDSISTIADTINVGVSALRSVPRADPAFQDHPANSAPDKTPLVRQSPHERAAAPREKPEELHDLSDGLVRVLTLGRDPLETDIDGLRTAALFPGAIPSRASLPASVVLIIDESGFSRGVWKSFGGSYDDYLLSELEAVRQLVGDGRVRAITLTSDNTLERFRITRSWGVVASSSAEADQLLRAAAKR